MLATRSLYADSAESAATLPALTDFPCPHAPQQGVHLYHFPLSLCSQKVRQILEEKGVYWQSHVILLPAYEQYDPAYARINPRCVVPALVCDGKVTTDSQNILRYADHKWDGPRLCGDQENAACVDRFVAKADALFVEALTYGDVPGLKRPLPWRLSTRGSHAHKLELLARLAREHAGDSILENAYQSKLALVRATKASIESPENMKDILEQTKTVVGELDDELRRGPFSRDAWLCGAFSLADIEWGVVLYRFRTLGLAPALWRERSQVEDYAAKLFARPSFRTGVVAWHNPLTNVVWPMLAKRAKAFFS